MTCKQCDKTFTPALCPHCGASKTGELCPECIGGTPTTCPVCGKAAGPAAPPQPQAPGAGHMANPAMQPQQRPVSAAYGNRPLPTQKVPLGGWLMLFFVFTCIGLGFSVLNLLVSVFSAAIGLTLVFTVVFSILPSVMIVLYIIQRDIKFKYWYYFMAIVNFIGYALGLAGVVMMLGVVSTNPELLNDALTMSGYEGVLDGLAAGVLNAVMIGAIVVMLVGLCITIAWWVYFNKSRRVAYTFDPRNNPPK